MSIFFSFGVTGWCQNAGTVQMGRVKIISDNRIFFLAWKCFGDHYFCIFICMKVKNINVYRWYNYGISEVSLELHEMYIL